MCVYINIYVYTCISRAGRFKLEWRSKNEASNNMDPGCKIKASTTMERRSRLEAQSKMERRSKFEAESKLGRHSKVEAQSQQIYAVPKLKFKRIWSVAQK